MKENIELLTNSGVCKVGEALNADQETIVVVGTARGGTSIVAGTLSKLGVFMGDLSHDPVYEDRRLSEAFESGDDDDVNAVVDDYNGRHDTWGWKRPSSLNYLSKVHNTLRNPKYIFIFKDILAVANRNTISMKMDLLSGMSNALQQYQTILNFITEHKPNAMLLSADKIVMNKKIFIESLVDFLGDSNISQEMIDDALKYITPNPRKYLDQSRITKSIGSLGNVNKNYVSGWAKRVHTTKPVNVILSINGEDVAKQQASIFRKDLVANNIDNIGECGFVFELEEPDFLKDGDIVSVRAEDDIRELQKSPVEYISK